ncbi:replication-associated recombination protein A [bacterium]|jgi:putative ATPase|nr:replication-associated recombination protein A [bacterium]
MPQSQTALKKAPLAYLLSPKSFEEYVGQQNLVGPGKPLRLMIDQDQLASLILWGPPGCGKTALSRLISQVTNSDFLSLNAVTARIADIKSAIERAEANKSIGRRTVVFVDEIHRFNKTQQDALLPDVESGTIILIGATTENPFFSVIPALVSRSHIFELNPLESDDLRQLIDRALASERFQEVGAISEEICDYVVQQSQGDARRLLNIMEVLGTVLKGSSEALTLEVVQDLLQSKGVSYGDDDHYNVVSAFIKSVRGSDVDAALYWLARMIRGGEDPRFIARRLIILASEDVGNADPMALVMATSALQAVSFIGFPEAQLTLSQVTSYLATAPKSNASTVAIMKARKLVDSGTLYSVPAHLKDSHYKGAKRMGYGEGYQSSHNDPTGIAPQSYMPEIHTFYEPVDRGYEATIRKRLEKIRPRLQS